MTLKEIGVAAMKDGDLEDGSDSEGRNTWGDKVGYTDAQKAAKRTFQKGDMGRPKGAATKFD
jgi:hypothetical protein